MSHPDAAITQHILGLPLRLRTHRTVRGLTLRQLADAMGINHSTLHRIEHGQDYTVGNLIAITTYLDGQS